MSYKIVSGCPMDIEEDIPSEEIEFPQEVVKSFMTFKHMLDDIESSATGEMMLTAPTITAHVLRLIHAFCSAEFYGAYCQYLNTIMPKDIQGKDTIESLIDKTDPGKYKKIVEQGKAHILTLVKFEQDPNDPDIYEILLAAEYLNCKLIIDVTTSLIANLISGKSPEQISALFNIPFDDLTEDDIKEAVAKVRQDHGDKIFLPEDTPITIPSSVSSVPSVPTTPSIPSVTTTPN